MSDEYTPSKVEYREAYEAWKKNGQALHTALLDIWRSITPDSEYGSFGDDPQEVVREVRRFIESIRPDPDDREQVLRVAQTWATTGPVPNNWQTMAPRVQAIMCDRARAVLTVLAKGRAS